MQPTLTPGPLPDRRVPVICTGLPALSLVLLTKWQKTERVISFEHRTAASTDASCSSSELEFCRLILVFAYPCRVQWQPHVADASNRQTSFEFVCWTAG
jgi:hypothetical protein